MDPYYHNIKSTIVIIIIIVFFFVNSIQTQILGFLLDCICAANQDFFIPLTKRFFGEDNLQSSIWCTVFHFKTSKKWFLSWF